MRKTAVTFEAVRAVGREFPDVQESTMYGSPALMLGKRLVACLAIHRSAEPGSLVVRTDFEQRSALLADDALAEWHRGKMDRRLPARDPGPHHCAERTTP